MPYCNPFLLLQVQQPNGWSVRLQAGRRVATLRRRAEGRRLAEYPSLVTTARVRRAEAIVLNLADIGDSFIAVPQTGRHGGDRTSCGVSSGEYMTGRYNREPAPPAT